MSSGVVEHVNVMRGVFCVRCPDGTFAYFRAAPRELPKVGDEVQCRSSIPTTVVNVSDGGRLIALHNSLTNLPASVALALIR